MKKTSFIFLLLYQLNTYAQEFQGCGIYQINGIRRVDKSSKFESVYIVNEGTRSELKLEFKDEEDVLKMSGFLNVPTTLQAKILIKMDGTKGEIVDLTKIAKRFPNPLSTKNLGLTKVSSLSCKEN